MTTTQNGTPKTWEDVLSILDARPGPELHPVECPELGGLVVKVRGLSRAESLRIEHATSKTNGRSDTAKADEMSFLWGVVEPKATPESYRALKQNPAASPALQRIHTRITALTGILREARKVEDDDEQEGDAAEAYFKSAPE